MLKLINAYKLRTKYLLLFPRFFLLILNPFPFQNEITLRIGMCIYAFYKVVHNYQDLFLDMKYMHYCLAYAYGERSKNLLAYIA